MLLLSVVCSHVAAYQMVSFCVVEVVLYFSIICGVTTRSVATVLFNSVITSTSVYHCLLGAISITLI